MKSFKKIILILGFSIILIGIVLTSIGLLFGGNNHLVISNGKVYTKKDYHIYKQEKVKLDKFNEVSITTADSTIEIIPSDDYYIEYSYTSLVGSPSYKVENNVLTYSEPTEKNTFSIFSFSFDDSDDYYVKLYVPKDAYFDRFYVNSSSGDIKLNNFTTDKLDLNSSYGNVTVSKVDATSSVIKLSSGDSTISDVNTGKLNYRNSYGDATFDSINTNKKTSTNDEFIIDMSSGDVKLKNVITNAVQIKNSYGDVSFDGIITKSLTCNLSSGSIHTKNSKLGNITIDNSYGDVILSMVENITEYDYDLNCDYGTIKINDTEYEEEVKSMNQNNYSMNINVDSGDIDLSFPK